MIKIGDFSHLSRVPVKTLRYYDEIGLFKPAHIDPFTSYRFYTIDQLPQLHRILALKELGLSLEQIATLMKDDLTPEQIRGMLRLKQVEIQQHIVAEQDRLARVEMHLRYIEMERKMSTIDAVIKQIGTQRVLSARAIVQGSDGIQQFIGEAFDTVFKAGIKFAGAPFVLYYSVEESAFDMEVVVPVEAAFMGEVPLPSGRKMIVSTLPAATVVSTLHRGAYDSIGETYAQISKWISENDYAFVGACREIYLKSYESTQNPAEFLTEIQYPVEKIAHPVS
jgi:DNA-binding transcriptional MerR regulator